MGRQPADDGETITVHVPFAIRSAAGGSWW